MNEKKRQEIPKPINLDDLYTSQEEREEQSKEKIEIIDLDLIDDFSKHPFKVQNNDELNQLKNSIETNGVLSPILIRPKGNRYEMISGHRRKFACKLLGKREIPCIIKDLTDDEAIIHMVDSNLQREKLLPSEKAYAYKMKYEAIKHQRGDNMSQLDTDVCQVGTVRSDYLLSKESEDSARQIQRYLRLSFLIRELLDLVDNKVFNITPQMSLSPAVELSYLKEDEQKLVFKYIDENLSTPNMNQALELKRLSQNNILNKEALYKIMNVEKPNQVENIKISINKLEKFLPRNLLMDEREEFIINACEHYSKYLKNKERER